MHGLVSLLPEPHYTRVENIWQELETRFGLSGIQVTPYPPFLLADWRKITPPTCWKKLLRK